MTFHVHLLFPSAGAEAQTPYANIITWLVISCKEDRSPWSYNILHLATEIAIYLSYLRERALELLSSSCKVAFPDVSF